MQPPLWQPGGHLQTILPALFRRVGLPAPETELIPTPDNDLLLLNWYRQEEGKQNLLSELNNVPALVVLTHGLEGCSSSPYMSGMVATCLQQGTHVLAWNFRGCGDAPNLVQNKFYHSGATYDLLTVLQHALGQGYNWLVLIGFSLGGNLTLKFAGELGQGAFPEPWLGKLRKAIESVAVISVPVDLAASSRYLERPANFIYEQRFLKSLKSKIQEKERRYPGSFPVELLEKTNTIRQFDDNFTAPLHGFGTAENYYRLNSSKGFIEFVSCKTFIINARNDVFLPPECYPEAEVRRNALVQLITPLQGGHCGFQQRNGSFFTEKFVAENLLKPR